MSTSTNLFIQSHRLQDCLVQYGSKRAAVSEKIKKKKNERENRNKTYSRWVKVNVRGLQRVD